MALIPVAAAIGDGVTVAVPVIAKGAFGNVAYESVLVIANPNQEPIDVNVGTADSNGRPMTQAANFRLAPQEIRKITMAGGEAQAGYARIFASKQVNVSGHIIAIPDGSPRDAASQVTVLAEPFIARAVIPVIRNSVQGDIPVENTGVAIVNGQGGTLTLRLALLDSSGTVLLTRTLNVSFFGRVSLFVNELFPAMPANFTFGSLVIDGPFPYSFAATALYTTGPRIFSAAVSKVDLPLRYSISFKSPYTDELLNQLSSQYGFILVAKQGDKLISVDMTDEVARAVARDPRIQAVGANGLVGEL